MDTVLCCPLCESPNIQKRGFTRGAEPKQIIQCQSCQKYSSLSPIEVRGGPSWHLPAKRKRELERAARFIITSAMNNTPVDTRFWGAVQEWASHNEAEIIVVPIRYRNPTSPIESRMADEDVWWPQVVQDYLSDDELHLHPKLWLCADIRVQATAVNPLTGFEAVTKDASAIIGHSQVAMTTVATPGTKYPKILTTTGSASVKNYSNTRAGKRAKFHHSLGAVIVEKVGDAFLLRNVVAADDGTFHDLDAHYSEDGMLVHEEGVPGLVLADEHERFKDRRVHQVLFGPGGMVDVLKPKVLVRHDSYDGYAPNPHHRGDPVAAYAKHHERYDDVEAELVDWVDFIKETTPEGTEAWIVSSNHHDFLMRWLKWADPKTDPRNALIYHELMLEVLRRARIDPDRGVASCDPLAVWAEPKLKDRGVNVRFLGRDEVATIKGIGVSFHGDRGPSGARGSRQNLAKIGVKLVVGHGHGPGIYMGCYQTGANQAPGAEYTAGHPGNWLPTQCVIQPDGKRQLLTVIGDAWHGCQRLLSRQR